MAKREAHLVKRDLTGKCLCGKPIKGHPVCDGCGILCGIGHEEYLSEFRGHNICGLCIRKWKKLDALLGYEVSWEQFKDPTLFYYREAIS